MNKSKELIRFVDDLIMDTAKHPCNNNDSYVLDWDKVDEQDKQHIVALMIDGDGRELYSIYENDKSDDIVSSLLSFLKKDTQDSLEDFAECVRKNVMSYYEKAASELLEERLGVVESSGMLDAGLMQFQDRNSGEIYWGRY